MNQQDATLKNVRAQKKREEKMKADIKQLKARLKNLEIEVKNLKRPHWE